MTDAERARSIRWLRFPQELEKAYQVDYWGRIKGPLRVGLLVLVFVVIVAVSRETISAMRDGTSLSQILIIGQADFLFVAVLLLVLNLLCAATFLPGFWRYWHVVLTLVALCLMDALFNGSAHATEQKVDRWWAALGMVKKPSSIVLFIPASLKLYDFLRYPLQVMVSLTALRLPFRWMLLALSGAAILTTWVVATQMSVIDQPGVLERTIQVLLQALVVLALGSLIQERLSRETFLANYLLAIERAKSENLLLNILPDSIAQRLKEQPGAIADQFAAVTVLFADIADFTPLSVRLPAEEVVALLNEVFSAFDTLAEKYGMEKIKTIGDAYMAVAGLPEPHTDHAGAAANMALEMQAVIARFQRDTGEPLRLRVGLNTGPVVAGVIGTKKFIYDLWGDTVNTASRMEAFGIVGSVQVTDETRRLLEPRFAFGPPREVEVKGKGLMTVYILEGSLPIAGPVLHPEGARRG